MWMAHRCRASQCLLLALVLTNCLSLQHILRTPICRSSAGAMQNAHVRAGTRSSVIETAERYEYRTPLAHPSGLCGEIQL